MHSKGNYKHGEKITLKMGVIISNETTDKGLTSKVCKQLIQVNTRNKNKKPTKNKQINQKVGKRPKQTFLQRRPTDG